MAISKSKIMSLCTKSEVELVRASRKPELEQLSAAEVKRLAVRTRKLVGKWQGLSRGQSRTRQRQTGSSAVDPNTQLKSQIFSEALGRFEAQLAKLDSSAAPSTNAARPKTSKVRKSGHRTERAAIRKDIAEVKALLKGGRKSLV